jgi:hypothetical protein
MAIEAAKNFGVSATGGSGSAGQPQQYAAGIDRAQDFMEMQSSAKMNKSGVELPKGVGGNSPVMTPTKRTPLDAPTERPDEHPATGAATGPGGGMELLPSTAYLQAQNNEDMAKLAALLPIYARIAEMPNASNATRNFYRALKSQIGTPTAE